MKFATIVRNDRLHAAVIGERGLLDLGETSLDSILDEGADAIDRLRAQISAAAAQDWITPAGVRFAVPLQRLSKVICVGLNYRDHAAEGGHPIPEYPALFIRTANSIVAHGEPLVRPRVSKRFDYEAELAVVIGKTCRHVAEDRALDMVFGYTVFNDGSIRDYQRKSSQWTAGKCFDATGALGPAIVTADSLPRGATGLRVRCTINGETLQDGNTGDMIFPVARIIAILSEIMTLEAGTVIAMGTPAGVGFARNPPVWLKAGDVVDITIQSIGTLSNRVVDEDPAA